VQTELESFKIADVADWLVFRHAFSQQNGEVQLDPSRNSSALKGYKGVYQLLDAGTLVMLVTAFDQVIAVPINRFALTLGHGFSCRSGSSCVFV
jgi:hypothetical protein